MTIEARISKLEKMSYSDDELVINVNILGEDGSVDDCSRRQDNCPVLPCTKKPCLYHNPNDTNISVDLKNDD